MIIFGENYLVFNLPHAGGLHNLLENSSLDRPQFTICHCLQLDGCHRCYFHYCHRHHHCCLQCHDDLDACCSLAVVEDRQLSKCFANPQSAEDLAILDDFIFSLGRDVDVGPELPCKMIARL